MKRLFGATAIFAVIISGGVYFITTGPGEYGVGQIYYSNLNNPSAATSWFQKAAVQGYAPVEPWVQQAAAAGYAPAQYALGLAGYHEGDNYYIGQGVPQNDEKSTAAYTVAVTTWIQQAVDQGYQPAADLLAVAYLNGNGVPHDVDKAETMLQVLANEGCAPAEFLYGMRLAIAGDPKATFWIQQAKAQGYTTEIPY
jgi:TPR repeat protein